MAFLEQRGGWYRVVFTFRGERFAHAVGTTDKRTADAIRGGVERTILQIQQRLLVVPDDADIKNFVLTGGHSASAPVPHESGPGRASAQLAGFCPVFLTCVIDGAAPSDGADRERGSRSC